MKTTLLLACAGKGTRAKFDKNKLLVKVNGKTILEQTLSVFYDSGLIDEYVVTSSKEDYDKIKSLLPSYIKVVEGGNTRTQSIKNGLSVIDDGIVLIHDGARPFVDSRIIKDCIESATLLGSGITAIPSRDTVSKSDGERITEYLGKNELYSIQTPQAFKVEEIKKAYLLANDKVFNDDGEVYKEFINTPHLVLGSTKNTKLTYSEDFDFLNTQGICRIGVGFDCHKLVPDRKLILGGIEIPHTKGLLGHSDADVLTHAIMDACLSALSMRDIGYHFPDTDDKYKNADSIKLLKEVLKMIDDKGYKVNNVSAVIMADKPKLLKFIPQITENLALVIGTKKENIGIGATTLEGLGFVGREEGICVHANATLIKK